MARTWIYPAKIKGSYQKIHRALGIFQLPIFLFLPWLQVGGHPAVQLDIPARRLFVFGQMFGTSDTVLVVLGLLFLAFSLFFFTALFGRLWCGYLCPQSVFLEELIRPIETLIEGDRAQAMLRDARDRWKAPWIWRKALKWSLFVVISVIAGMSFVGWFADPRVLFSGAGGPIEYSTSLFFSAIFFLDFTWFREQFCNYLCPYARFQGALTDANSLVVAYDTGRGEPRGTRKKATTGACIDCKKCVTVCPQGIDIRNGYQLECIGCARCVDACTSVMDKLQQPSLVVYTTQATLEGRTTRWMRPRIFVYAGLLSVVLGASALALSSRHELDGAVNRSPGSLFTVDEDGWVRNTFLLRVTSNHGGEKTKLDIAVEGLPAEADIRVIPIEIAPEQTTTIPLIIRIPPGNPARTLPINVKVTAPWDELNISATFKNNSELGG